MLVYTNCTGVIIFDDKYKVVETAPLSPQEFLNEKKAKEIEEKLTKKHKAKAPDIEEIKKIMEALKPSAKEFYYANLAITKRKIKEQVNEDNLIIQTISNLDEVKRISNTLAKRLREWYELHNPEISKKITDHEKFTKTILNKDKKELLNSLNIKEEESMGAEFSKEDIKPVKRLAEQLKQMYEFKEEQTDYLGALMKRYCPNVHELAGTLIGAKLISLAGSLKKLSILPSSTVQLLGAERALFRHMQTKARPPKHGVLVNHQYVMEADRNKKGKAARVLANKISIAAKVDYNKGDYIADKLKEQLEKIKSQLRGKTQ